MNVFKFVLILLFCLALADQDMRARTSTGCTSFRGKPGNCVSMRDCPKILSLVVKLNHTYDDIEYLIKTGCKEPYIGYVCCEFNEEGIQLLNSTENFENCGPFSDKQILHGEEVDIHSRPWMAVFIFRQNNELFFRCEGTLINKRFVLTAANCFREEKYKLVQVRLGEHKLGERSYCRKDLNLCEKGHVDVDVKKIIVHNDYNPSIGLNDIALVKLARDVEYDEHIRPICLPLSQELMEMGQTHPIFKVTGWWQNDKDSNNLSEVRAFRASCNLKHNTRTLICAKESLNNTCFGVSGDPLMYPVSYYGHQRFVQFGFVSTRSSGGCSKFLTRYTNVAELISWISLKILV